MPRRPEANAERRQEFSFCSFVTYNDRPGGDFRMLRACQQNPMANPEDAKNKLQHSSFIKKASESLCDVGTKTTKTQNEKEDFRNAKHA